MFYGTFSGKNNLMCEKNTLSKVNGEVSKPEIVLRQVASNTGGKTRQMERPEDVHQNRHNPGQTRRVDRFTI